MSEHEEYALIVDGVGVPVTGHWSMQQETYDEHQMDGRVAHLSAGPPEFTFETTREAAEALTRACDHGLPVPFAFLGDEQPILGYLRVTSVDVGRDISRVTLTRDLPKPQRKP